MKKRHNKLALIILIIIIISALTFISYRKITGKVIGECLIDKNQCQRIVLADSSYYWQCNGNQVTQKMLSSAEHSFIIPNNGGPSFIKDRIIWYMIETKIIGTKTYSYGAIYSNSLCGDVNSIERISQLATKVSGTNLLENEKKDDRISDIFPAPYDNYYFTIDEKTDRVIWKYVIGRRLNNAWQYSSIISSNSIYGEGYSIIDLSRKVIKDFIDLVGWNAPIKDNRAIWYEIEKSTSNKDFYYNCLTGGSPRLIVQDLSGYIILEGDNASWTGGSMILDKCTCEQGICCNLNTGTFYTRNEKCSEEAKEKICQDADCAGKIMEKYETRYCSGSSSECAGEIKTELKEIQKCGWDKRCQNGLCVKSEECENKILRLISPRGGEAVSDVDEFLWNPGIYSKFILYVSNSPDFTSSVKCKTLNLPVTKITLEKCWKKILKYSSPYYWKIEANGKDSAGNKIQASSEAREFVMKKAQAPSIIKNYSLQEVPSIPPALPMIYWNPGIYNKKFKVQISRYNNFTSKKDFTPEANENFLNLIKYNSSIYKLGASGNTLYWRVYAQDKYNTKIIRYSDIGSFVLP